MLSAIAAHTLLIGERAFQGNKRILDCAWLPGPQMTLASASLPVFTALSADDVGWGYSRHRVDTARWPPSRRRARHPFISRVFDQVSHVLLTTAPPFAADPVSIDER